MRGELRNYTAKYLKTLEAKPLDPLRQHHAKAPRDSDTPFLWANCRFIGPQTQTIQVKCISPGRI